MNDTLFRAYFEQGLDIGKIDVLIQLAAKIGLPQDDLRLALESHTHLPSVLEDEKQASEYGLTGVPAFIYNGHGLIGVQSENSLEHLLAKTV